MDKPSVHVTLRKKNGAKTAPGTKKNCAFLLLSSSLAKQGDNVLGSVRPSVCLSITSYICQTSYILLRYHDQGTGT